MKHNKKLLILAAIAFFTLAGTTLASSSTFLTQAQKYINQHCDKKNITNQTALLCYLFNKSQEQDANITAINSTLSPIPDKITTLQNQQVQLAQNETLLQASISTIAASINNQ